MSEGRRIAVRGIILKDGKMLCQELKPTEDGKARDYWCTPGGGLDSEESLRDGLYREMIEETGIAPKIGRLLFVQQFSDSHHGIPLEQMEFFFLIENPDDYETVDLSTTTHGELEIDNVAFIDPRTHNILPAFLQRIDVQEYVEKTLPVLVYSEL